MAPDLQDLLRPLLSGALTTVELTVVAAVIALPVALAAGLGQLSRWLILRVITTVYIEFFRGSSALVQLFLFFYVLPLVGMTLPPFMVGALVLGLNLSAYGSQVVRAAIVSVDTGQDDASVALNFPRGLAMRRIILPQAIVQMLPAFGNELIELLKLTSLVSLITLTDLSFAGKLLLESTGKAAAVFGLVLVIYFLLGFPITRLVRRFERMSRKGIGHAVRPGMEGIV